MAKSPLGVLAILMLLLTGAANECPRKDLGEADEDCPWAGAARVLAEAADGGQADVSPLLKAQLAPLAAQIAKDAQQPALLAMWGESVNHDDHKGVPGQESIVHPAIVAAIGKLVLRFTPNGVARFTLVGVAAPHDATCRPAATAPGAMIVAAL